MSNINTAIITIGDELLIGQTIDTNSAWIAQHLNAMGIDVQRRVAVGDTRNAIWTALEEELGRNELIIITGGLGPTADDITKPLLCEFFGGTLKVDETVLAHVQEMFRKRNRPFLERNMKQAEVPDVCKVLFNKMGTAPGMWFERDGKVVISLPGVPFEMIHIMQEVALPLLRKQFTSDAIVHRSIITVGEGESFIAERIKTLEEALPEHIKLAYLPHAGIVRLRLSGRGKDELQLIKEVELHRDAIAGVLQSFVVGTDDLPLEHLLGKVLVSKGQTLAMGESCSGGLIGHLITQINGASRYFMGSLVCYHEQGKEDILNVRRKTIKEFGVVSEEVAREMAAGSRNVLKSDIGFGITGMLSPSDDSKVPAGTVCIAVTDGDQIFSHTYRFHVDRLRNKELAANMSMLYIWKFIQGRL